VMALAFGDILAILALMDSALISPSVICAASKNNARSEPVFCRTARAVLSVNESDVIFGYRLMLNIIAAIRMALRTRCGWVIMFLTANHSRSPAKGPES